MFRNRTLAAVLSLALGASFAWAQGKTLSITGFGPSASMARFMASNICLLPT